MLIYSSKLRFLACFDSLALTLRASLRLLLPLVVAPCLACLAYVFPRSVCGSRVVRQIHSAKRRLPSTSPASNRATRPKAKVSDA